MVAYTTPSSRQASLSSGWATYFSRSRGRLWQKGETSGHRQALVRLLPDCDGDAWLLLVRQEGVACHTGAPSCFSAQGGSPQAAPALLQLWRTLEARLRDRPQGSYTVRLAQAGTARVAQKVIEEAGEAALAAVQGDAQALTREAADLLYHLWLLLMMGQSSYAQVAEELLRRAGEGEGAGGGGHAK
jgi:phosphoribosyl-ATP pyrophosphohydrolase/phosphoribosyl-AMP cyclohydrolase